MKVFITGAAGFIGGYVAEALRRAGHRLVCLVWEQEAERVPELLAQLDAELVIGDVTDKASFQEAMLGCDALIHLAGIYSIWEPDSRIYSRINVDGTRAVMQAALEAGVSKAIYTSTYAIWGGTPDSPFTESSPPGEHPATQYARTKRQGELEAWKLHQERGLPLVVIYPCNVLGAGDTRPTGSYISHLIRRSLPATIHNDHILTFVHVRDVAQAFLRALEKPGNAGQGYIIGKERLTVREYNRMIAQYAGVPLPALEMPDSLAVAAASLLTRWADLTKHPPLWGMGLEQTQFVLQNMAADGSKAERELGLRYTPVCEAIEESIAWYRSQY
jgi:dihydroflavonol-4-reductase